MLTIAIKVVLFLFSQKDNPISVDHSHKSSPIEVCQTEQEFGRQDEEIHTPIDCMQKGKYILFCETDEEFGEDNVSE